MNKKPTVTDKRSSEFKYQKQVEKSHYKFRKYLHQERWISYYHQIKLVDFVLQKIKKDKLSILEIGVGDSTVSSVLKNQGINVSTMDIDSALGPDRVSALPDINLPKDKKFDCVLCCEVLEHIRYKDSEKSLENIANISKYAVISVPHKGIALSITIKLWFFKTLRWFLSVRSFRKLELGGEHYWELGANGVTTKRFKNSLESAGFKILNDYRVPEFSFHHFFVVKSQVL